LNRRGGRNDRPSDVPGGGFPLACLGRRNRTFETIRHYRYPNARAAGMPDFA